ncbi:hypothetical protein MHYP_G00065210 [Metynnis hypsauchen]
MNTEGVCCSIRPQISALSPRNQCKNPKFPKTRTLQMLDSNRSVRVYIRQVEFQAQANWKKANHKRDTELPSFVQERKMAPSALAPLCVAPPEAAWPGLPSVPIMQQQASSGQALMLCFSTTENLTHTEGP